jgi:hypothetical protein
LPTRRTIVIAEPEATEAGDEDGADDGDGEAEE